MDIIKINIGNKIEGISVLIIPTAVLIVGCILENLM